MSAAAAGVPLGIRVNAFCPTAITRQSRKWFVKDGLLDPDDKAVTAHLNPDRNAPFVVFLASDASQGLNARLFYTIPTSISTDAKFRIKEVFVAETDGIVADSWTAEEIAGALRSFTRSSDRQGDWLAALASPLHTPSASEPAIR